MRGAGRNPQALLDRMAPTLGAILADPRIKEIAVTPKGLRLVRQAGEGRRGEHLLLRQAVFDDAAVTAGRSRTACSVRSTAARSILAGRTGPAGATRHAEAVA